MSLYCRLEVKAVGKPKPEGKWLKNGEEITPSNEFVIENYEDGTSVLTISEVYPDDTGEIVYEAHNPLGVAITTTLLSVEGNASNRFFLSSSKFNHDLISSLSAFQVYCYCYSASSFVLSFYYFYNNNSISHDHTSLIYYTEYFLKNALSRSAVIYYRIWLNQIKPNDIRAKKK